MAAEAIAEGMRKAALRGRRVLVPPRAGSDEPSESLGGRRSRTGVLGGQVPLERRHFELGLPTVETQGEPKVHFKYEVSDAMVGKPYSTWTDLLSEGGTTIDLFLFSTSPDLEANYSEAELDQLLPGVVLVLVVGHHPKWRESHPGVAGFWPRDTRWNCRPPVAGGAWAAVSDPIVVSGTQNTVTLDAGPASRYFRLKKP